VDAASLLDDWADKYGELKHGGPGRVSAWLGIPVLVASLLGILWSIPVPSVFRDASPEINYAMLFVMASFIYYCILSVSLGLGALLLLLLLAVPSVALPQFGVPLGPTATAVFVVAMLWQLLETRQATGKLMPGRNFQYLMLGPIWLLRACYRRLGLRY